MFIAAARPTLSVDRLLGHSFKTRKVPCDCLKVGRDEVETYRVLSGSRTALCASRTNGLAADRRTALVGICDKHDSDHLRMQCIRRRALTYLEATPTRCPFCFLQRRLPASRLGSLPARHVAKWHSIARRIGTAYSPSATVV